MLSVEARIEHLLYHARIVCKFMVWAAIKGVSSDPSSPVPPPKNAAVGNYSCPTTIGEECTVPVPQSVNIWLFRSNAYYIKVILEPLSLLGVCRATVLVFDQFTIDDTSLWVSQLEM